MSLIGKSTAAEEWKSGWPVVLASFFGFSFFSIMTGSLSIFMDPLAREFGWSKTLISGGLSLSTIVTAILSPFFGILIDRFGSRRVALPGLVTTIFAIAAFSLANGSVAQWLGLWVVYAFISIAVKTTVWTAAVAGVFDAGRGLALGITLAGTAVTQTVLPPLAQWLIGEVGWRMAYVWLAFGWGGLTFVLCWIFLNDPRDRKAAPPAERADVAGASPEFPGLTIAEARRDTALWRIAISTFILMTLTAGLMVHQISILAEAGVARANAAWLASLAGVASIIGKLITGMLLDRFRANWVGGLTLGCTALAFGLLIDGVHSPALIVLAMLVNGYSAGSKLQICSYLTARYGGMRHFGTIFGVMTSLIVLGTGAGPMIAGLTYDFVGGYSPFLLGGTIGCVFSGFLFLTLPAYPEWGDGEKDKDGEGAFA